jgi:hypothetical protein
MPMRMTKRGVGKELESMLSEMVETEEQRRRRVSSRIRNEIRGQVMQDLVEFARMKKLPDRWQSADQLHKYLDERGYWVSHRHVLASFLSPEACIELLDKALDSLVCTHPEIWMRVGNQFMPANPDWSAFAADKANLLQQEMPGIDRTVLHGGADGESILFSHDNYADPRVRDEVAALRQHLRDSAIPELGFGTSNDGQTWVMVVWSQDEVVLSRAMMAAWQSAFQGQQVRQAKAA